MDKIIINNREALILYISSHLIDIRKEAGISQAQLSQILDISKNTIINVEKAAQSSIANDEIPTISKVPTLSWPVVISIVTLFQQLQVIRDITENETALELLARCALLTENGGEKNRLLHSTLIVASAVTVGNLSGLGIGFPLLKTLNTIDEARKNKK